MRKLTTVILAAVVEKTWPPDHSSSVINNTFMTMNKHLTANMYLLVLKRLIVYCIYLTVPSPYAQRQQKNRMLFFTGCF